MDMIEKTMIVRWAEKTRRRDIDN